MQPDVTITIVSYNTKDLLRACLNSLPRGARQTSYEVHVVDNASTDGSPEMVAVEFPEVRLIANTDNAGFAKANNQSWEISNGRYWFLFNSDAEFFEGSLDKLVEFANSHPKAGLVSARLETPDGQPQWCANVEPAAGLTLLEASRLHKLLPAKKRGHLLGGCYFSYEEEWEMGFPWGTALLARREAVEQVGPLDESFWMYGEDTEWGLRVRRAGWQVWYCPQSRVLHHGGASSAGSWTDSQKLRRIWDSQYGALRKHQSEAAVRRLQRARLLALKLDALTLRLRGRSNPETNALIQYHQEALRRPTPIERLSQPEKTS